jgi:hypothetical protein
MPFDEFAKSAAVASLSTQYELTISLRFSRTTFWVGRPRGEAIQLGRDIGIRGRGRRLQEG